ncbi:MAG: hypothetical protein U5L04_08520 [Trueperaceae bacterium]|nr:hypothetical protein [Trueperaceae bacterium]
MAETREQTDAAADHQPDPAVFRGPLPDGATVWPIVLLMATVVLWIPLELWLWGLPTALGFLYTLRTEPADRRLRYLALAAAVVILALAPVSTDLDPRHIVTLGSMFALAIIVPTAILWGKGIITFSFWPKKWEGLELLYTASAVPLAWGVFQLYFVVLHPDVPFNWTLPPEPDNVELFKLFMGINAVGIWDELFFINVSYAIIRSLFPYRIANPAQAVLYTGLLWDMAFRGLFGPVFVYVFAITQGAMFERSRVLLWVLVVHLIVDFSVSGHRRSPLPRPRSLVALILTIQPRRVRHCAPSFDSTC